MIRDFQSLGGNLPGEIFEQIGHYQPWSLAATEGAVMRMAEVFRGGKEKTRAKGNSKDKSAGDGERLR
jgi:hypothetical protein